MFSGGSVDDRREPPERCRKGRVISGLFQEHACLESLDAVIHDPALLIGEGAIVVMRGPGEIVSGAHKFLDFWSHASPGKGFLHRIGADDPQSTLITPSDFDPSREIHACDRHESVETDGATVWMDHRTSSVRYVSHSPCSQA